MWQGVGTCGRGVVACGRVGGLLTGVGAFDKG